jgi:hypothetical protein
MQDFIIGAHLSPALKARNPYAVAYVLATDCLALVGKPPEGRDRLESHWTALEQAAFAEGSFKRVNDHMTQAVLETSQGFSSFGSDHEPSGNWEFNRYSIVFLKG